MRKAVYETVISATQDDLWSFHSSVEALKLLAPPQQKVAIVSEEKRVIEGALHHLKIGPAPFQIDWIAHIHDVRSPQEFTDTAQRSPFRSWTHHHEFLFMDAQNSILRDTVEYEFWVPGLTHRLCIDRMIDSMFAHRHRVTEQHFSSKTYRAQS